MSQRRRKIVAFLAGDREACERIIETINANGRAVDLVLAECREVGGIGFLVFQEKRQRA